MASLSQHAGWLLLSTEPTEQQLHNSSPMLFAGVGCFCLAASAYAFLVSGFVSGGFTTTVFGLFLLLHALLYALPVHRHLARLMVRVALTLTFLALAAALFLTFGGDSGRVWLGTAFALVFLLVMFCTNYFVNRRRFYRNI